MSRKETLQEKLLNYYPTFLTRLPDSVQYKFIKTIRNSLLPIYTTLKILDQQENLDRPILIWKEQTQPYTYNLHFQVNIDNLQKIEIYRENETEPISTTTYLETDEKNQYYHILKDIPTEKPIPDTKYYIHVTTYDEYEFYKGYPENDYPITDYLQITQQQNPNGTYRLNFKTKNLKNITNFKIETYTPKTIRKSNNTPIETEPNTITSQTNDFTEITYTNKYTLTQTLTSNYNNNWNNNEDYLNSINKYLEDNPTATYNEAKNFCVPETQDKWEETFTQILENGLTENKYVFTVTTNNNETYQLILERNHLQEDIYDHDYALDIIGKRLNFPRSKFTPYTSEEVTDEFIEFYENTEPPYNDKFTEDDYHYSERMKFYCENIQAHIDDTSIGEDVLSFTPHRKNTKILAPLELPQLEIYKYWGLVPEMVNRHKYLVRQNKDNMRGILCGPGDEGIKIPTTINLNRKPTFVVGKQTRIYAAVFEEETQEPVKNGNVVFKITQKNELISSGKVNIHNYQAVYTVTPKYTGEITVELIYQGTGKYKRSRNTLNYNVSKVPTRIYAKNVRTIWGNTFNLSAHVVSSRDSTETVTGTINFTINSIDNTPNTCNVQVGNYLNEGKFTHTPILNENGGKAQYNVTANYNGDDTFEAATTSFRLTVTDEPAQAYLQSIFIPPNMIGCKLFGENGNELIPVSGKQVEVRWHNVHYDTITTSENYTPFSKSARIPENLGDLKLIFPDEDEEYYGTSYEVPPFEPLTLEDTEILIPEEINCLLGQNNILTAILLSKQGTPLSNKTLKWKIGTEDFGEYTTDENGVCMVNYTPTLGGDYSLTVEYEGESLRYYPTSSSGEIHIIDHLETRITVDRTTVYVDGTLQVTLQDENNNPVPYQTIKIKNTTNSDTNYGQIFATGITDVNGIATIQFNMTPKSNKQVQIIFDGDEYECYNPTSLDIPNFTIRKHPINMTTTPTRGTVWNYGDNNKIQTTLLDGDTLKPLTGFEVYWHFTRTSTGAHEIIGPEYTNNQGIAEHKIGYSKGEYSYGVIVTETDTYTGKDTYTIKDGMDYRTYFTIDNVSGVNQPQNIEITVTPRSIVRGDDYTVTAKVTGIDNIAPTGEVTVYIGTYNETTKTVTGTQGKISLTSIGNGISTGSVNLTSSATMNPTNNIPIKGLYTGDTHYSLSNSTDYTNGTAYIDVTDGTSTSTGKKDLTEFKVTVTEDTANPGDKYHINVDLKGDGITNPTGNVIFYTQRNHTGKQGETNLTTSTNGRSIITNYEREIASNANPATYTIYAYYVGDDNYNVADSFNFTNGSDTIIVQSQGSATSQTVKTKPSLSLNISPNPVPENSEYSLTATITRGATGTIIFSLNGNKIGETEINNNGKAILGLNTTTVTPNGSFTALYNGDTNYSSVSTSQTATMTNSSKKDTHITLPNTMTKGTAYTIKLTDNDNNPVIGYTVKLTLTGNGQSKTYALQPTNYLGESSLEINLNWATGTTINVDAVFEATGNYNGSTNSADVTYYNN